ncbi:MAG: hypothetical protein K6G18_11100 [Treponema sp.]|nr:hypothetical protein [Treponema sp.]
MLSIILVPASGDPRGDNPLEAAGRKRGSGGLGAFPQNNNLAKSVYKTNFLVDLLTSFAIINL